MSDETPTTTPETTPPAAADETFGWTADGASAANGASNGDGPSSTGRDWLAQLQSMIENITEQAGPALREISAKAAELAAVAGEKAGPAAARAAEFTAGAGTKLAERSRDLAAELRRDIAARQAGTTGTETPPAAPSEDAPKG